MKQLTIEPKYLAKNSEIIHTVKKSEVASPTAEAAAVSAKTFVMASLTCSIREICTSRVRLRKKTSLVPVRICRISPRSAPGRNAASFWKPMFWNSVPPMARIEIWPMDCPAVLNSRMSVLKATLSRNLFCKRHKTFWVKRTNAHEAHSVVDLVGLNHCLHYSEASSDGGADAHAN